MLIFQISTFSEFPTQKVTQTAQESLGLVPKHFLKQKQLFQSENPGIRCYGGSSKHTFLPDLVKQGIV